MTKARSYQLVFASQAVLDARRMVRESRDEDYKKVTEIRESLVRLDTALAAFEAKWRKEWSQSLRKLEEIKNVSQSITSKRLSDAEDLEVPCRTYADITFIQAPSPEEIAAEAAGFSLLSDNERINTINFHGHLVCMPTYSQLRSHVYLGRSQLSNLPEIPRPERHSSQELPNHLWVQISQKIKAAKPHLEVIRELGEKEIARLEEQRAGISEDDPALIAHRSSDIDGKRDIVRKLACVVDGGSERKSSLDPNDNALSPEIPHCAFDATLNVQSYERLISLTVFSDCKELEAIIKDIIDAIEVVIPRADTPSDIMPKEESGDKDSNEDDSDDSEDEQDSDDEQNSSDEQDSSA